MIADVEFGSPPVIVSRDGKVYREGEWPQTMLIDRKLLSEQSPHLILSDHNRCLTLIVENGGASYSLDEFRPDEDCWVASRINQ